MSKISLVILGLVLLVCLTVAAMEVEETSLREVRDAAPDPNFRKLSKKNNRKLSKKNNRKLSKKNNRKLSKKNNRKLSKKNNRKLSKKNNRKLSKKNNRQNNRQSATVSDACFEQSITIMKMWKDVISNFEKQRKRMRRQNETAGKKSGKKGAFGGITQRLVEAGGGDKSAPSCAGSTDNDGAKQLANLTKTLDECSDNIQAVCDPSNIPQPNMTFISMCDDLVSQFKVEAKACLDNSVGGSKTDTATACNCWTNTTLNEIIQKVKLCKASDEAKAVADGKDLRNIRLTFIPIQFDD